MKPSFDIPQTMLNNEDKFKDPFFKRFTLRHADWPIKLTDKIQKNYKFPTFYGDVTCAMAICFCSYNRAKDIVQETLGKKVYPVSMLKGRAIVAFSCYEYKNVMNINPYNEIAIAIPILVNQKIKVPVLPMVLKTFKHFGYFIAGMPVTSYENTLRGHKIWSLPKVTHEIEMIHTDEMCTTIAKDSDGKEYLTVKVPKKGKKQEFDETGYLYSRHNGKIIRSKTCFKATFNVNTYFSHLFKKDVEGNFIEIGNSKEAEYLNYLDIEPHPFQFRYAEHMNSCFDLPDENPPSWLKKLND